MLIALYYSFKPYLAGFNTIWESYNNALIFVGLGISVSTLQDTTKTQNKFSKKIWKNPKKGKIALLLISVLALFTILSGIYGVYISTNDILKELSYGIIVLGIGLIGLLKAAIELFENHRKDRK